MGNLWLFWSVMHLPQVLLEGLVSFAHPLLLLSLHPSSHFPGDGPIEGLPQLTHWVGEDRGSGPPTPGFNPPTPAQIFPCYPRPLFFPLFFFSGTPVPNSNFLPPPIWPPPIFRQKSPYPWHPPPPPDPPVLPHHWGSRDFQSDFNDSNILLMLVQPFIYFCYQPFHKHGLTLIPEWISNYINY